MMYITHGSRGDGVGGACGAARSDHPDAIATASGVRAAPRAATTPTPSTKDRGLSLAPGVRTRLGASPHATSPDETRNTVMYSLTRTGDLLRRRVAVLVPQLVADLGQQLLVAELDARVERVVADDAPVARRHRDAAAARVVR